MRTWTTRWLLLAVYLAHFSVFAAVGMLIVGVNHRLLVDSIVTLLSLLRSVQLDNRVSTLILGVSIGLGTVVWFLSLIGWFLLNAKIFIRYMLWYR